MTARPLVGMALAGLGMLTPAVARAVPLVPEGSEPVPRAVPPVPGRDERDEPAPRAADAIDFMNLLSRHGLHDPDNERWNLYGQFTWISSFKLPFGAPYTNLHGSTNSLTTDFEHSFTGTLTLFGGLRLWPGAEVYWVPEVIAERALSGLAGLGGAIQNFELQKQGSEAPTVYSSRVFIRQSINLGGRSVAHTSEPMQLGGSADSRRLVFTVGNFSILDFLDRNAYASDLRRQFFNMAFLTHAAYDFAADARGYTWGAVAELYFDDWALRVGHTIVPVSPNQLPLDFHFWQYFGDQVEIEHLHTLGGLPGSVRVLGYRNLENMARFDDAIAVTAADPTHNATTCTAFNYGSHNATAPDLCWARRPNVKLGIGVNLEQSLGHGFGVFFRAMYSDGATEEYSFTSADRSFSLGVLARGALWHRPNDYTGVGFGGGWISASHAAYLQRGGVDGFIGDGQINPAMESVTEVFYGLNLVSSIWLSGDYQFIVNPGFNADRGPVHVLGARFHAEF